MRWYSTHTYCTVYNMYLREKNCVTKKWVCGGCVMAVRWICDGCKCVMCVMDVWWVCDWRGGCVISVWWLCHRCVIGKVGVMGVWQVCDGCVMGVWQVCDGSDPDTGTEQIWNRYWYRSGSNKKLYGSRSDSDKKDSVPGKS